MIRKRQRSSRGGSSAGSVEGTIISRVSWWLVCLTTIAVPLIVSTSGQDSFRLPKQLAFIASGLVLAALACSASILGSDSGRSVSWSRSDLVALSAVLAWSAVTTIQTTNRSLSVASLLIVASGTMLFIAAYKGAENRTLPVLGVLFLPAIITSVLALSQWLQLWDPTGVSRNQPRHVRAVALLGNSNDVGMFLLGPALAAAALAMVSRRLRIGGIAMAILFTAGVLASETAGAIVALAAAFFVLAFIHRRRATLITALFLALFAGVLLASSPGRRAVTPYLQAATEGKLDEVLSGRMLAFRAAWRMFLKRPVFGVGLGCFRFHYFDEKTALDAAAFPGPNFADAHNEHLQILAETGLPGYAIFLGCLALLGKISLRRDPGGSDVRSAFAEKVALPFAFGIAVLALSSFPFRLAGPTVGILFFAAIIFAWRAREST